jgi:hypothetical protein
MSARRIGLKVKPASMANQFLNARLFVNDMVAGGYYFDEVPTLCT